MKKAPNFLTNSSDLIEEILRAAREGKREDWNVTFPGGGVLRISTRAGRVEVEKIADGNAAAYESLIQTLGGGDG